MGHTKPRTVADVTKVQWNKTCIKIHSKPFKIQATCELKNKYRVFILWNALYVLSEKLRIAPTVRRTDRQTTSWANNSLCIIHFTLQLQRCHLPPAALESTDKVLSLSSSLFRTLSPLSLSAACSLSLSLCVSLSVRQLRSFALWSSNVANYFQLNRQRVARRR